MKRRLDTDFRLALMIAITLIFVQPVFGGPELEIIPDFRFTSSSELADIKYYSFEAELRFEYLVLDDFKFILELKADRFEIDSGQISMSWNAWDYLSFKMGKFKPDLSIEDYVGKNDTLFITNNLVSDYINFLGYETNALSFKLYKKYDKHNLPISYLLQASFNTAAGESQFDAGFFYHFHKKDSYLGFLGSYYPFIIHDDYFKGNSESVPHNFLLDIICCDYENDFRYGAEFSLGSNLIDPIGLVHFPGNGGYSFFWGGDLHAGYKLDFSKFVWTPALRFSILFPDISVPECQQMEFIVGNCIAFKKQLFVSFDAGLGIDTNYSYEDLLSDFKLIWAVQIAFRL